MLTCQEKEKDQKETFPVDISIIIERIKARENVKFDRDVLKVLGCEGANISTWKTRNTIPWNELISYSVTSGTSLDWLILGRSQPHSAKQEPISEEKLLKDTVRVVEQIQIEQGLVPSIDKKADLIALLFETAKRSQNMPDIKLIKGLLRLIS